MSQPTGPTGTPRGHPDPDLLADLVAAVLPPEQALEVEQHVVGCPHCAALLGDAEGVRRLLLADPVGPILPDVAARLDAALQREALWAAAQTVEGPAVTGSNGHAGAAQPQSRRERTRLDRRSGEDPPTGTLPKESFFDEPYPTAMIPAGSIPVSSPSGPSVSRLRRADRGGTQRTRRQVRSEERSGRVPTWLTSRPVLASAASLVAVLVLGTAVQQFTGGTADTAASSAAGGASADSGAAAPESAAPPVPVLTTGTDYTSARLSAQAKALITKATAAQAARRSALDASGASSESDASGAGGGTGTQNGVVPVTPKAVQPPAPNELLRDPAALDACLAAIDSQGVRPVAVDLATYQGREAAILVLPAAAGGYEVWAVSRTCKPGADGTLIFKPVT